MLDRIERIVDAYPHATALDVAGADVSYAELWDRAHAIAALLVTADLGTGDHAALVVDRGLQTYASYLACLMVGVTIVPVNPAHPESRLSAQLGALPIAAVLLPDADRRSEAREKLRRLGRRTVAVDADRVEVLDGEPGGRTPGRTSIDPPMYVLFTSGSTGRPKGVPIPNAAADSYIATMTARYGFAPGDRLSQCFDLTFDPSVFDLFCAWTTGAALVVPSDEERRSIAGFITDREVTSWFYVPSAIDQAIANGQITPNAFPNLKLSLFAGERLLLSQARAWREAAPSSVIENLYGPTEMTVTCMSYRLPAALADWPASENGSVPIGDVDPGHDAIIVDRSGAPAGRGELCLRGTQRFPGYVDPRDNVGAFLEGSPRSANTGERRIAIDRPEPDSFYRSGDIVELTDAGLVFDGRLDTQVKLGGHRIELGEIEAAARSFDGIVDAVAVVPNSAPHVHLFFVAGGNVDERVLRTHLFSRLPRPMVPRTMDRLARFPLTFNGKTDRRALQAIADSSNRP